MNQVVEGIAAFIHTGVAEDTMNIYNNYRYLFLYIRKNELYMTIKSRGMEFTNYYKLLHCLICGSELDITTPLKFASFSAVNAELICRTCEKHYPVVDDIPVMFVDQDRIELLLSPFKYSSSVEVIGKRIKTASEACGEEELGVFRKSDDKTDALGWEIYFWERWKREEGGAPTTEINKINDYLLRDREAGGRLSFFDRVMKYNHPLFGKLLINIGAGRDFLLEAYLEQGCVVFEQDIVLESLLLLKKRHASFCVCCDARKLPFADSTFDVLTSFNVLHHIWPIDSTLQELIRISQGKIHINEPNSFALTRLAFILPSVMKRPLKKLYSGDMSHSPYEQTINPFDLRKMIKSNKWVIREFKYMRDSWISGKSLVKTILRLFNLAIVIFAPLFSAHFEVIAEHTTTRGTKLV